MLKYPCETKSAPEKNLRDRQKANRGRQNEESNVGANPEEHEFEVNDPQPTVVAALVAGIIDGACQLGLDRASLLSAGGLSASDLCEPDRRIPYPSHLAVWRAIDRFAQDETIGLRIAEATATASTFDLLGYLLMYCDTVGDLLRCFTEFGDLLNQGAQQEVIERESWVTIEDGPRKGQPWPAAYSDHTLASYVICQRAWAEQPIPCAEVHFSHPAPKTVAPFRRLFGDALLCFDKARDRLIFARDALAVRLRQPEPRLRAHLETVLRQRQTKLAADPLLVLLREQVWAELPDGTPSVATVARRLNLSARTLQRRLADRGLSFTVVVEESRRGLALTDLRNPELSVAECGFRCGFTSPDGFRRAVIRWTGQSPRQYRARSQTGSAVSG